MRRLLSALILTTACSPYLQYNTVATRAYGFSAPCGQGPFALTARLKGARWGEQFALVGFARHAVVGRYTVTLSGKRLLEGDFATERLVAVGSSSALVRDAKPQNQRCIERPVAVAAVAPQPETVQPPPVLLPPAPPQSPPPGWRPMAPIEGPLTPPDAGAPQPEGVPAVAPVVPVVAAQLIALESSVFVPQGDRNLHIVSFTWPSLDELGTPMVPVDAELEVTLWSQEPNDWDGAMLQLIQEAARPNVTEAEYIAYLHKERREAEADAKRRQEEAQREADKRNAHCQSNHDDEDCWGKGGYDAYVAAYYAPRPAAKPRPTANAQPTTTAAPTPEPPKPRAPDGPPPPAQLETPPPMPSAHAEWVTGYWKWTGFAWLWLGGWWKVPQQDLVARATVIAPLAPPPMRVELTPPPPMPGAVWLAGAWYWDGRIWLWHPGQWTLPPQPGLMWQPPTWTVDGRGVRLVPGSWGVTLRLP